jgi:pimeloyl-ACP methyl ester carboxylesterase
MKPDSMMLACEFPVSFGTIRGLQCGQGGSRKVLAVHGWLDNAASFSPLAPLLADAHVVAVDLAGHGHSDHRAAGACYHLVDYVPDVVEVAEVLGWSEFTLLGHSLGAGICSLIAAAYPERARNLCLIDGIGPISGRETDCPQRLRRSIEMRRAAAERAPSRHNSVDVAVRARLQATKMHPDNARAIIERNLIATEKGYLWRTDRRVTSASPLYLAESQVRAFLGAIACPTLLLLAEHGVIVGRASTDERIACVSGIQVRPMPGDHHLHMDDAQAVAECINSFLDACECSAG